MNKVDSQERSAHQSNSRGPSSQKLHLDTQCHNHCGKWKREWHITNWLMKLLPWKDAHYLCSYFIAKASAWPCLISRGLDRCNLTFVWKGICGLYIICTKASILTSLDWWFGVIDLGFPLIRRGQDTYLRRG